jgi:hypothetical protein
MKKISIGLLTLIMAIGFAAFTTPQKAKKVFNYTYHYNGATLVGENMPSNYSLSSSQTGCNDNAQELVCVISTSYAPDGNGFPQFPSSEDIRNDENVSIEHFKAQP